jgi:hypothetical protein
MIFTFLNIKPSEGAMNYIVQPDNGVVTQHAVSIVLVQLADGGQPIEH